MARVLFKNVEKEFDGKTVIHDCNLEVYDKEFLVFVGPSGCGKSTTLRMVAGLEDITRGELYIGDRLVNHVEPKDRDIAMVFQNYALYPHMTVYENMAFGLKLRKIPKAEIDSRVREAAAILGIDSMLERKPKALSGGERQRVALGRAIVRKPKVFLLDEPLSNLDAKLRVRMRAELTRLHRNLQATIIYVTHDQVEAMTMGTRIVVLKDGYIQQVDAPIKLYESPQNVFVGGFIGSPAMNFLPVPVREDDGRLWLVTQDFRFPVPDRWRESLFPYTGRDVILGIRPESIIDGAATDQFRDWSVHVTLDVVEPMGNDTNIYFSLNGVNLVGRVALGGVPNVLERFRAAFDLRQAYFFDPETQIAIPRGTGDVAFKVG